MSFSRTLLASALLLVASSPVFAQKTNDLIRELQRDIATLQLDLKLLNSKFDEKIAVVSTLLEQALKEVSAANTGVAVLDRQMKDNLKEQQNLVAAPVASLGSKVDVMSQEYASMNENVKDLNQRMVRLQTTLSEIDAAIKMMAAKNVAPPPPDPNATTGTQGAQGGPPAGVTAEQVYLNAMKDKDGGNFDLALTEFQDYLRWFPQTELAANAQFYVGECLYYKNDFEGAINAFDTVIEQYASSNKVPDAMYLKGRAQLRQEKRTAAIQTFDELYKKHPSTEAARKGRDLRRSLSPASTSRKKR